MTTEDKAAERPVVPAGVTRMVCRCGRIASLDWVALWDFCPACAEKPFCGAPVLDLPPTNTTGEWNESITAPPLLDVTLLLESIRGRGVRCGQDDGAVQPEGRRG